MSLSLLKNAVEMKIFLDFSDNVLLNGIPWMWSWWKCEIIIIDGKLFEKFTFEKPVPQSNMTCASSVTISTQGVEPP